MAFDAGSIEARLTVDTAQASADLSKFEAEVKALEDGTHTVKLTADTAAASAGIAKLAAEVKALEDQARVITLGTAADTGQASAEMAKLDAEAKALEDQAHTVKFGATADTTQATADLAKVAAEVDALTGTPHEINIGAVFDNADISLARRAFQLLDNAISLDAMQRLRSSPQGSVLGALNALFSPHPVIGGPSPQQAAASGLLGQMVSAQGGGNAAVPGAQGESALRDVVTGTEPEKVTVTEEAAQGESAAGAGALTDAADAEKAAAADLAAGATAETAAAGKTSDAAGTLDAAGAGLLGAGTELLDAAGSMRDAASDVQRMTALQVASMAASMAQYLGSQHPAAGGVAPAVAAGTAAGAAGGGEGALPVAGTAGATEALSRLDDEIQKNFDDYSVLVAEMNDMREPAIIAAMPDLEQFDQQLRGIGKDLEAIDQPGAATAEAVAAIATRIEAAGVAMDQFEESMPQALADLDAMRQSSAASGTAVAAAADRYANASAEMAAYGEAAQNSGDQSQSAVAKLLGLAASATTAASAAQYASAAQKAFTGSETDAAAAAKDAAAALQGMTASATSSGDASRYAYAAGVAESIALKAVGSSASQTSTAVKDTAASTGLFTDAISKGMPLWQSAGGAWGFLQGHVTLFGGALTSVGLPAIIATASGLHLLTDGIIEVTATLLPAIVGLGAFAASAIDTTDEIYNHFTDLNKVTDELGQNIYPLTGQFGAMNRAAQPQVYVLLGEGLQIVSKNSGVLQTVAQSAGQALDQLGARFTYAMTSGNGFGAFVKNSGADLAGWGNLIGNLGGILGNFFKVMPGYAEDILAAANGVTHFIEVITGSGIGQDILGIGLAVHGAVLYIGLLGTAAAALISRTLPLLAAGAATVGSAFDAMGATGAAAGLLAFSVEADRAAALPWGWISLVAAGVGVLVYELVSAKTAAQQFADGVQTAIEKVQVSSLGSTITADILDYTGALKQAQVQEESLAATSAHTVLVSVGKYETAQVTEYSQATYTAKQNVADYGAALQVAQQDQTVYNSNLAEAAKVFGTTGNALAALSNAGVTSTQMLTTSKQQMAENIIEAQGYNDALKALTDGTGRYAAAMNALSGPEQYLGDMLKSIQAITQAQDTLMTTVTEGETSFDTFGLGMATLNSNFAGTSKAASTASHSLGDIKSVASLAGAALGGTSQASLTLSQSFYSQISSAQQVIDALEQQEAPTKNLTAATATLAGQMLPYAGTNVAARTTIISLINDALGPGTVSMQNLNTWVDKNQTSMGGLSTIIGESTVKASQLANVLQGNLNNMLAQAAANALGGQKALDQFAQGIENGDNTATLLANDGGAKVIAMFEQMYQGSIPQAKKAFIDWAQNGLGVSLTAATNLWNGLNNDLNPALGGTSSAALTASAALEQHFIADLKSIGSDTPAINTLIGNFANAILTTGNNSTKTESDRAQLIKDLEAAGVEAQTATSMVGGLQTQIDGLHGKSVPVTITATAQGTLNAVAHLPGASPTDSALVFAASGMLVTGGTPGKDSVLIAAMPGEVVVPTAMVNAGAVDHLRGSIPGFAAGGMVNLDAPGQWAATQGGTWAQQVEQAWASASQSAFNQSATAAVAAMDALKLSGSAGSIQAMMQAAAAAMGWTGAEWAALNSVEMREAGYNPNAVNPTSGAYGLAQFIGGQSEYYQYGGNPTSAAGQITGMLAYIAQRYGDPEAAWAHEQQYGWYDKGGTLQPGWTVAYNGTGKPEQVTSPDQAQQSQQSLNAIASKLDRLILVTSQVPAGVGQHVGGAINGASAAASFRSRYPRSSP